MICWVLVCSPGLLLPSAFSTFLFSVVGLLPVEKSFFPWVFYPKNRQWENEEKTFMSDVKWFLFFWVSCRKSFYSISLNVVRGRGNNAAKRVKYTAAYNRWKNISTLTMFNAKKDYEKCVCVCMCANVMSGSRRTKSHFMFKWVWNLLPFEVGEYWKRFLYNTIM